LSQLQEAETWEPSLTKDTQELCEVESLEYTRAASSLAPEPDKISQKMISMATGNLFFKEG
jgi:hypothetical protein